jgi:hypothetical protein
MVPAPIERSEVGGHDNRSENLQHLQRTVNRLATQYAFVWADCSDSPVGTCLTELGNYTPSASLANIAPQLTPANIGLRMFQVMVAGSNANVVYAYPTGQTPLGTPLVDWAA